MNTDNKTLADVQPGGRVRLGDQAERARFEKWMTDVAKIIVGSSDPYPAGLERDYWRVWQAALSAQPSPGGQGDGLAMAAGKLLGVVHELCLNDDPHPPKSLAEAAETLQSVLAGRSPLGSCNCCGGTGYVDDGEINCYPDGTPYECGPVKCVKDCPSCTARQPVGEPVVYGVPDGNGGVKFGKGWAFTKQAEQSLGATMPLYAAPPAQAVDLGQFRPAVELMEWQERGHANPDFPRGDAKKHAEALRLLALIDSQAVRNG